MNDSLEAAAYSPVEDIAAEIKNLYVTRGGYTHSQVDEAGYQLLDLLYNELKKQFAPFQSSVLHIEVNQQTQQLPLLNTSSLRYPLSKGAKNIFLKLATVAPARAEIIKSFQLEIPKDCGTEDDLVIHEHGTTNVFEARMMELIPTPITSIHMRISITARRFLSEAMEELKQRAIGSLGRSGYGQH